MAVIDTLSIRMNSKGAEDVKSAILKVRDAEKALAGALSALEGLLDGGLEVVSLGTEIREAEAEQAAGAA